VLSSLLLMQLISQKVLYKEQGIEMKANPNGDSAGPSISMLLALSLWKAERIRDGKEK
jgi:hypothetical protein